MEYILNNTLLALLDYPGSTMLGVNRMMSDKDFRKRVYPKIKDPVVKGFWINEFDKWEDKFRKEAVAAIQNKVGQDFQVTFREVSSPSITKNLITKLIKAWMMYIEAVTFGKLSPGNRYTLETASKDGTNTTLTQQIRAINYMSSIYYFKLAPDGKTISYYNKYTGVFPKLLGNSVFSSDNKENIKQTATFQTNDFEDLDTDIISEFNILAKDTNEGFKIIKKDSEVDEFQIIFKDDKSLGVPFDELQPYNSGDINESLNLNIR
jgi:hypothetical protein